MQGRIKRRTMLLAFAVTATLVLASGVAFAVTKVCPTNTTSINPCRGTAKSATSSGNDILIGTGGPDYILALSGNDLIIGAAGADITNGGGGNDTYSYRDGWGTDLVDDRSGIDTLNFSRVGSTVSAYLIPEAQSSAYGNLNEAYSHDTTATDRLNFVSGTYIEKIVGTSASGSDILWGGKVSNTFKPAGGGTPDAPDYLTDIAGCTTCLLAGLLPASNDLYKGFDKPGFSVVNDWGGKLDTVDLRPLASHDAYLEKADDDLVIYTSDATSGMRIGGYFGAERHIEKILFSDTIITSFAQAQSLASASAKKVAAKEATAAANAPEKTIKKSRFPTIKTNPKAQGEVYSNQIGS